MLALVMGAESFAPTSVHSDTKTKLHHGGGMTMSVADSNLRRLINERSAESFMRETAAAEEEEWLWLSGAPLPPLEELKSACYLVAEGSDRNLFLCAEPMGGMEECMEDEDYSYHYGQPVYLCPGGWALPAM